MTRTVGLDEIEADIERAVVQFRQGRPAQAVRSLVAIRGRVRAQLGTGAGDRALLELVGRTLMSEAAARFDISGDRADALAALAEADVLAQEAGARSLAATIRAQRALVLLRSGDTRGAMAEFDDAVARFPDLPLRDQAIVLLNRGVVHLEHAALAEAERDLRRSMELGELLGDTRHAAMAQHNLGYVDFLAGRLPRALAALDEAQRRLGPQQPHPAALLDRARVLREAGLLRDADTLLEDASAILRAARLHQDLAETELVRAECALVQDDSERGSRLAASAHRRFGRRSNVRWQRKAELLMLRCDRAAAEDKPLRSRRTALRRVAARADALAATCFEEGRQDLARAATLLAQEARLLAGDVVDGIPPPARRSDPLQTRLQTREVRALAALRFGELTAAAREVRRGLGELGAYQHSFGSLDLRTASAVHGSALARLGLDVALRSGSPAAVLNLVEQARAISTRLPSVRPPSDERTAELLSELRQVEEEARGLEGDPAGEDALAGLRERAADLQRRIRARAWEVEGRQGEVSDAPRCAAVLAAAKEAGTAFVTFARHQGRWVAVCVCGSRSRLYDLAPIAEVTELVNRVRADLDALALPALPPQLREAVRRSLDTGLSRLDTLLVAPMRLGVRPVVVSCSGDLVVLPWGLLPSRLGVSTVVTPSAASWLRVVRQPRPAAPRVVAVAGPDLRCAAGEAEVVGSTWADADVLCGDDATSAAAHRALVAADLAHIAAHGRHRPDNPLFSSVRLVDGQLYAYEIDPGAGMAGCVVLSACEAGLATLRPGDESLGLTHVLLHMGAKGVIAGVARVGDDVSAHLMERLHRDLRSGMDSAAALATALHESVDEGAPAAFVSFGAPW